MHRLIIHHGVQTKLWSMLYIPVHLVVDSGNAGWKAVKWKCPSAEWEAARFVDSFVSRWRQMPKAYLRYLD
jgi:hypothetical protein